MLSFKFYQWNTQRLSKEFHSIWVSPLWVSIKYPFRMQTQLLHKMQIEPISIYLCVSLYLF